MPGRSGQNNGLRLLVLLVLVLTQIAGSQQIPVLLRLQRSTAELEIDQNRQSSGNNIYSAAASSDPRDVWKYPNSITCLVVYGDGKYVFEKREERTPGSPKAKSAEGVLSADDLLHLQAILDDQELKKVTTPKTPVLPDDTEAVRNIERLDAQIDRDGSMQRFTMLRERVKTGAVLTRMTAPSSGMDTYLDNGVPYKKTLRPLMKWFDDLGKKSKSALKDSEPKYCAPMNVD